LKCRQEDQEVVHEALYCHAKRKGGHRCPPYSGLLNYLHVVYLGMKLPRLK
jgi:hypothetical protein